MKKFNIESMEGLKNGFQSTFDKWAWIDLRKSFVSQAFNGILMSLFMAFIVMLLTT